MPAGSTQPLTDARISPHSKPGDETHGIWANGTVRYLPTQIRVDDEGRFKLEGLIPGWQYSGTVFVERADGGRVMRRIVGKAFVDETVTAGEHRELGNLKSIGLDRF
jgi:hypothetical protein